MAPEQFIDPADQFNTFAFVGSNHNAEFQLTHGIGTASYPVHSAADNPQLRFR